MIKHIVQFKLKETDLNEKNKNAAFLKKELESLIPIIKEIKYFEIGINYAQLPQAFDLVLISEFENDETLNTYKIHPAHQKILGFINDLCSDKHVVNYEIEKNYKPQAN